MKIRSKNKVRKTAGNNAFLARVKRAMNADIYARTLAIANTMGEADARAFLGQFVTGPVDAALDGLIAALDS